MKSLWVICINSKGTKWLKEDTKYLIEPKGTKAKVLRTESNPHLRLGSFNKNRFKQLPVKQLKPML